MGKSTCCPQPSYLGPCQKELPAPCGVIARGPTGYTGHTGPAGSPDGTLAGLTDTTITGATTGSVLVYNNGTSTWSNQNTQLALGGGSSVGGVNGIAIGTSANSVGDTSVALGNAAVSTGVNSIAIGAASSAAFAGSVVLGAGVTDAANDSTVYVPSLLVAAAGGPTTSTSWAVAAGVYRVVYQDGNSLKTIPVTLS